MDPRVVPEQFLGSRPMIAVFRNAGGRATPDVVRTINTLQSLAYKVQKATVMVVHHTGTTILLSNVMYSVLSVDFQKDLTNMPTGA